MSDKRTELRNRKLKAKRAVLDTLLVPGKEYPIYTIFGMEEAAQVLQAALKEYKAKKADQNPSSTE